jgi:hypothetical protein
MRLHLYSTLVACLGAVTTLPASAASLAGVCPDGSAFVVQKRRDVPCAGAKLVEPGELPPLRPLLLPKPYMWYVDQEARDQANPYHLVDPARKLRALQAGETLPGTRQSAKSEVSAPETLTAPPESPPQPAFEADDLKDLVRLIALRQEVAPATLSIDDVQGHEQMRIALAHSDAFELELLEALQLRAEEHRVLAFFSHALRDATFHPNFLVAQDGATFRPEPSEATEVGMLVGEPGALEGGLMVVGYIVIPARFDLRRPMDLFWNDRSIRAVLTPRGQG